MSFNHLSCYILLLTLLVTTGCAKKIALGTIDDGLKPKATASGKVHIMPIIDNAGIVKFDDGFYSTVSNKPKTVFRSETRPSDMMEKSIVTCLTQAGLIVTSGPTVPEDADLVLTSNLRMVHVDPSYPVSSLGLNIAVAVFTGIVVSGNVPNAAIVVLNIFDAPKAQVISDATFAGDRSYGIALSQGGCAENAFRLVQNDYCGWLQQKVAAFRADPVAASQSNQAEALALAKTAKRR